MIYHSRGNKHTAVIGGKSVAVDSNLEERVLRWLEDNGFANRWEKPAIGLNEGVSNYTHDVDLSIQLDGLTHRALVEIKPSKKYFTAYISRRMRGVAKFYNAAILLLYCEKENIWYRVDVKTGALSEFGVPVPGKLTINILHRPLAWDACSIYAHRYKKRIRPGIIFIRGLADTMETLIVGPKTRKRRRRRKK